MTVTDARELLAGGERLLVAGALHTERIVEPRERDRPEWYQPPHVRDARAARRAQLEQAEAGAHVLVAQTFRTTRRALARYGEARRAREWTMRAVDVAREAAEAAQDAGWGLDRTGGSASTVVLVAGAVPELSPDDVGLDPAAALAEYREHVGHLTEAGVDLLLVEPKRSVEDARAATLACVETGVPVLTGVVLDRTADRLLSGGPMDAWAEAVVPLAPDGLLLDCLDPSRLGGALGRTGTLAGIPVGVYTDGGRISVVGMDGSDRRSAGPHVGGDPRHGDAIRGEDAHERPAASEDGAHQGIAGVATGWLDAGASVLGLGDGATPARVVQLRLALDERQREERERRDAARARWLTWVIEAARRAPGGPAVWIEAGREQEGTEPAGFEWLRVPEEEVRVLPEGRYRLVVSATPSLSVEHLARLVGEGGVLLARTAASRGWSDRHLEILEVIEDGRERLVLARRR